MTETMNKAVSEINTAPADTNTDAMVADCIEPQNEDIQTDALPAVYLPCDGYCTIRETATQMAAAYEAAPEQYHVYNRNGKVVYISSENDNGNSVVSIKAMSPARACSDFARVADIKKYIRGRVKGGEASIEYYEISTSCNTKIASMILESPFFLDAIPKLNLTFNCPVLNKNGSTCKEIHGYDRDAGFYAMGTPAESMSLAEAKTALEELFQDFKFKTPADKARAYAALLTPALISGNILSAQTPLMMLEADKSQTGKGFFTKVLSAVYNEVVMNVAKGSGGGVGSFDESFDTALLSGHNIVVLDNLRGKLNSQRIESFLTAQFYTARIAYKQAAIVNTSKFLIMATSNECNMTKDMSNRSCFIRLLKREQGYKFSSFPEGNLLKHVQANSAHYLGAVFAVIKEWVTQGCPITDESSHDFRDWTRALDWIVQNLLGLSPLMVGNSEIQTETVCSIFPFLSAIWDCISRNGRTKEWLTAQQIAESYNNPDHPLPGSKGLDYSDLRDLEKKQVYAQLGRLFSDSFKKNGNDEFRFSLFIFKRQKEKSTFKDKHTAEQYKYCFEGV